MQSLLETFRKVVRLGDVAGFTQLLQQSPEMRRHLDDPIFSFGSTALRFAVENKNRPMIDALLDAGADINKRSEWEAGSFGVLDHVDPVLGEYLISRGAVVDIHAAAGLGDLDQIKFLLAGDPFLVNARGGDGGTPLHFAKNPEVIDLLLSHGADLKIRDLDHGSTAAMWQIGHHENLYRLIDAGSEVDIFMACRHGDVRLAERVLENEPHCLGSVIGRGDFVKSKRGDMYIWSLLPSGRPLSVSAHFQHKELSDFLYGKATDGERLVFHGLQADETAMRNLLASRPGLMERLSEDDLSAFPIAIWLGNQAAAEVFLSIGFPLTGRGQDNGTALHVAAWVGDPMLVRELLKRGLDLNDRNDIHGSTPLGWACHGAAFSGRKHANYVGVVEALLEAGADPNQPANRYGENLGAWVTPEIAEVLGKPAADL